MPDIRDIVGEVAGAVSFIAFIPYIYSTLRGEMKPNRATWWIWTLVGVMLGASYYSSGADSTIWVAVSYVIGPLVTAIISIKYGEGGWTRFDKWCLLGVGVSLLLWWVFNTPLVALVALIFIDLCGALPTVHKVYRDPTSENRLAWLLFVTGNTLNLHAVKIWIFAIAVYPVYMFTGSLIIILIIFFRIDRQAKTV